MATCWCFHFFLTFIVFSGEVGLSLFGTLYFLSFLHFLIPYSSSFPYFPCLSHTFPPKILFSMPASVFSSSILPFLSLYPSLPYFSMLWIFFGLVDFTCIVSLMRLSSLLFYLVFLKTLFIL